MMQTESPYWLGEAYQEALSAADTGVMQRNLHMMKVTAVLLRHLQLEPASFLDYGGGHGVFTRLMRDHGFGFSCWDKHAANHFASGFEGDPDGSYKGVTAFEVLEHLERPGEFFEHILGRMQPSLLLVSSELFSEPVSPDWHYFYFSTGQHIAFYQQETLLWLAKKYGYRCVSVGSMHVFVAPQLSTRALRLILRFGARMYPLYRFSSLITQDHASIMSKLDGDGRS